MEVMVVAHRLIPKPLPGIVGKLGFDELLDE
jgi:hypothetical protein